MESSTFNMFCWCWVGTDPHDNWGAKDGGLNHNPTETIILCTIAEYDCMSYSVTIGS